MVISKSLSGSPLQLTSYSSSMIFWTRRPLTITSTFTCVCVCVYMGPQTVYGVPTYIVLQLLPSLLPLGQCTSLSNHEYFPHHISADTGLWDSVEMHCNVLVVRKTQFPFCQLYTILYTVYYTVYCILYCRLYTILYTVYYTVDHILYILY